MTDTSNPIGQSSAAKLWTVTSSRRLVSDRWLKLRADDCVTAEGAEVAPYYVLDYPDWVQVVAIDDQDHIILVEQYRHGLGDVTWELPAGAMDPSDSDPVAGAARELEEETGYGSDRWRYIARMTPNPASQSNHCHVILATEASLRRAPVDDPKERLNVFRVPVAEAVSLARSGKISCSMSIAALALALTDLGRW